MNKYLFLLGVIMLPTFTFAQNYLGLLNDRKHNVSFGISANPALNANTDYIVKLDSDLKYIKKYGFIVHLNFPLFSQEKMDMDVKLGAGGLFEFSERFKVTSGIAWGISKTEDLNGRYFHSGFKIDLLPGYYGKKWVFAPHLSMDYQPFINIKHSEYPKQAFQNLYSNNNGQYQTPQGGWFYQNNITFQTGVGGVYRQPTWQINLLAGFQYQPNSLGLVSFPDIGMMPFYARVNFAYSIHKKGKRTTALFY